MGGKADIIEFQNYRNCGGNLKIDKKLFKKELFECSTPFNRLMIWPNGDTSLCCGYRNQDVYLGNIKTKTIEELWKGEKINRIRNSLKTKKGISPTCLGCISTFYKLKN